MIQGKLIWALEGEIFDVAVDIRRQSPNFGKWHSAILSGKNKRGIYIPPNFAHGFCVLSEQVDFLYKCTDYYAPQDEYGIRWNDPDIGIDWPSEDFTISDKDASNGLLRELDDKLPRYEGTA